MNALDGSSYSQNVYFASNHVSLMHALDREPMTTDGGGAAYFGKTRSVNGPALELTSGFTNGPVDYQGAGVFILAGRGAGQFRRLVASSGNWVTLDAPWTRDPDTNSDITITMLQQRYLIVGNDFTDTGPVQLFGTSVESILSGNQGARMKGFWGVGLYYVGYQPNWFSQFLDNRITEGNYYHWTNSADSGIGIYGSMSAPYEGPLNLGTILRRNQLDNNSRILVYGSCRDVLVESNLVQNAQDGVVVDESPTGVLVRGNRFVDVSQPVWGEAYLRQAVDDSVRSYAPDQLMADWDFELLQGDQFRDKTGNGFPAIVKGGVTQSPRPYSANAAFFDGMGYLVIDQSPVIFNLPDLTVSFWLKPGTLRGRRGLVVKRLSGVQSPFVVVQKDASVMFEAADETGNWSFQVQTPPVLSTNAWVNIIVTAQQGVGAALYVNGVRVANVVNTTNRVLNSEPLILGRDAWGGDPPAAATPGFYLGFMDEIRVWPRSFSPVEIREMFSPLPDPPEGLRLN